MDAFWINHPMRDEDAARKVWQLKVAAELGLRIPRTCVTNDPDRARAFIEETDPNWVIYKAFTGTEENWRETRVLRPEEVPLIAM